MRDLAARFPADSVVDPDALVAKGLIKKAGRRAVKVLADGDIGHALVVKTHRISEAAREKLVAAGGRVEVIPA